MITNVGQIHELGCFPSLLSDFCHKSGIDPKQDRLKAILDLEAITEGATLVEFYKGMKDTFAITLRYPGYYLTQCGLLSYFSSHCGAICFNTSDYGMISLVNAVVERKGRPQDIAKFYKLVRICRGSVIRAV